MYVQALNNFPKHASIHLKYAGFLRHVRKDMHGALKHYKMAVECNDKNADTLGGYASFLHGTSGDHHVISEMYERAIEVHRFLSLILAFVSFIS